MLTRFDHMTVVVREVEAAKKFFVLLGFEEVKSVVISGETFSNYMGVAGIDADHVTLALKGAAQRTEIQLLHYRHPEAILDPNITKLNKVGFNHICFAVDDLDSTVKMLRAGGVMLRTDVLDFHSRKLVLVTGPEGITVELAEWH